MGAAHTPGPWFARDEVCLGARVIHDQGGCFEIVTSQDRNAATVLCSRFPWEERADEMRANARLIAAAPRIFDACNGLLGLLQLIAGRRDVTDELRDVLATNHRVIEAALAVAQAAGEASAETAIAKATGSPS